MGVKVVINKRMSRQINTCLRKSSQRQKLQAGPKGRESKILFTVMKRRTTAIFLICMDIQAIDDNLNSPNDIIQMANSQVQNCQRGILFLTFLSMLLLTIVKGISLIKKKIDSEQDVPGGTAYKEGQQPPAQVKKPEEDSSMQFDQAVVAKKANEVQEDDPTIIKIIKKSTQFQNYFFYSFAVFGITVVTGTSKAFSMVNLFFTIIILLVFNVFKLHKSMCEQVFVRCLLENLYLLMLFFALVNIWGATPVYQPYSIVAS